MSSALGDYIHFHRESYLNNATNASQRGKQKTVENNKNIFINFRKREQDLIKLNAKRINSIINRNELEDFTDIYNKILMGQQSSDSKNIFAESNKIITENALSAIANGTRSVEIDGITQGGDVISLEADKIKSELKEIKGQVNQKLSDVVKKLDAESQSYQINSLSKNIVNAYNILSKIDVNNATAIEMKKTLKNIKEEIMKMGEVSARFLTTRAGNLSNAKVKEALERYVEANKSLCKGRIPKDSQLITYYNELVRLSRNAALTLAKQEIGEKTAELTGRILKGRYLLESNDIIYNNLLKPFSGQGQKTEKSNFYFNNLSGFYVDYDTLVNQKIISINKDGFTVEGSFSKIDYTFTSPSSGASFGMSIKNYNLNNAHQIHLLDNMPLFSVLLDVDGKFANHYLNVFSARWKEDKNGHKYINTEQEWYLAQSAMKAAVFARAMLGLRSRGQQAELFLVNDNSRIGSDSVRIFNAYDIIDRAMDNPQIASVKLDNKNIMQIHNLFTQSEIDFYGKDEHNLEDANKRITNLLVSTHKKLLSASLNAHSIKNSMYGK